ncbi:flagellar filament capping protein FliD [Rhodoferax sp.]|uniref:flagellar filament capping protein FliD n=1 Tax=Rhodoferax sp. TaxID=50421 RepID=UPI00262D44E7|nr:flagellar filament capping protein FliD [Rhodoferax sp.]MDD2810526.1 flagellar filament capping protein FliD [Rhodoferax sp.]MDD4944799.1 flagellar filament capping protein FliD [Rhodoferax sp.]
MAISSPGVGSGLDVKSIVTQLVNLEKQPIVQLQNKGSTLQTKLSAYASIKSSLATLDDASTAMMDTTTWNARTFSSSNSTAITGSATSTALASSFSVQVNALAQVQSLKSGAVTSGAALGSGGRLDIQVGQWSDTTFNGGSNSVLSVSVASTDTLTDIAGKINNAGAGVSAVVVTSGGQDRLLIRGNSTGDASGFQIKTYDPSSVEITDGTTGVGQLAYAYNAASAVPAFYGMTQTQAAQNSSVSIDGIAVSSATNTVSDAVPGVTLNLQTTTTTAAQITVGLDKELIKTKIEAFRTAYNSIRSQLADDLKYDPGSKKGGPLQGDSTAIGLQNMLRDLAASTGPSGSTLGRLSDLGLEMQRDGTLSTNSTKLDAALQNPSNMQTFFTYSSGTASMDGIARRLRDFARGANAIDGNVTGRNTALQAAITRNTKDIDNMNARVLRTEARLYAQYSRLDANIGSINSLGNFVTQQIAQWNKTG